MKKLICMILCIMVMSCTLCGCSTETGDEMYDQFVVISIKYDAWFGDLYKVYDKDTYVMYYLLQTSYKFELCPVYDTDGSIMIYKEALDG